MNLITKLQWFASGATRHKPHHDGPDLADMGTAFGLDASMAAETSFSVAPPLPADTATSWAQRLVRRPLRR